MISFRDKEDMPAGVVAVLSLVILVLGFAVYPLLKPPDVQHIRAQVASQIRKYKTQAANADASTIKSQGTIDKLTWTADADTINASALQTASQFATKHNLKLTVFRTQRVGLVDNLVSLPYQITVEGSFLSALAFARDFEDPKIKLAVTQIQINSSDPNTDKVTANIGIAAFVNPKEGMTLDSSSPTLQTRLDTRPDSGASQGGPSQGGPSNRTKVSKKQNA